MTLIIDLTPSEEARLRAVARDKGVGPEELARQLIANLPVTPKTHRNTPDEERHRGLDELVAESQKLGLY